MPLERQPGDAPPPLALPGAGPATRQMLPANASGSPLRQAREWWAGCTPADRADVAEGLRRGVLIGAAALVVLLPPSLHSLSGRPAPDDAAPRAQATLQAPAQGSFLAPRRAPAEPVAPRFADLGVHPASADARYLADWVADARDNAGDAFVLVDKRHAEVLVFDAQARLIAATPVLLGSAPGDHTVPGIGTRPIELVRPEERTTPAGRFVGERGRNAIGEDVVWVDYDAAVSMHRVRTTNPSERRLQRLATPSIDDNRISYGCINVPVTFFERFLQPAFAQRRPVVYVLPEVRGIDEVFGSYDVAARHGLVRTTPRTAQGQPASSPAARRAGRS